MDLFIQQKTVTDQVEVLVPAGFQNCVSWYTLSKHAKAAKELMDDLLISG